MIAARTIRTALAAALLLAPLSGHTVFDPVNDDTDIFLANPTYNGTRPNVVIFMDNSANWGQSTGYAAPWDTRYSGVQAALSGFIASASIDDRFNVGLALFGEQGEPGNSGGYVRFAVRQMTATNKGALKSMIDGLTRTGDNTNNTELSLAMLEMYRYFSGGAAYAGNSKTRRDYPLAGGTVAQQLASGHAFANAGSASYVSPIIDPCQKNFIIYISNGKANDNTSSLTTARDQLASLKGQTAAQLEASQFVLSPSGFEGNWADEYADFMANSDCHPLDGVQNVYTYTLDILPGSTAQDAQYSKLLDNMATKGKGKYYRVTDPATATADVQKFLDDVFAEVQAKNRVFASTTLPVSVNVRGTNLNQVYIGVFRPDAKKTPKWLGNLKLYKLGVNTSVNPPKLFLADASGAPAENEGEGFISAIARSFWTRTTTPGYWGFRDATLNGVGGAQDSPDGDLVEKGGVAQAVRIDFASDQSPRAIYTCVSGDAAANGLCTGAGGSLNLTNSGNAFTSANANVTGADLGAITTYDASIVSSSTTATITIPKTGSTLPLVCPVTWSAGDTVKVAGAFPENYNSSSASLTSADNSACEYQYTIVSPSANSAQAVSAAAHNLATGDLITITGGGVFNTVDTPITVVTTTKFNYTQAGVTGSTSTASASAKKTITSLSGTNFTATATVPNHGYSVGDSVTITGANETMFNMAPAVITQVTTDSFRYTTSGLIAGTNTVATVTASGHGLSAGTYSIAGNSVAGYNLSNKVVSVVDANTLSYSLAASAAAGSNGAVGKLITSITRGTGSGNGAACGGRDEVTVVTSANLNIPGPFPYNLRIAGTSSGYDRDYKVLSAADVNASANSIRMVEATHPVTCTIDSVASPLSPVPAGSVVGRAITGITSETSATGTALRVAKPFALTSITAFTTATGTIKVGRTTDVDPTLRAEIINWIRGADNVSPDENSVTTPAGSDIRPSAHGDVLHSRPAVVNYNRFGTDNDIYAFYGSNDGLLRAVKGGTHGPNPSDAPGPVEPSTSFYPGDERWGFIPKEFFGKLRRLRDNTPTISSTYPKDYFADGSVAVYTKDVTDSSDPTPNGILRPSDGDKVYIYVTMRRGGNFIYALDVTDPGTPKLLWRKGISDTGWDELGQTWSEPKIAKLQLGTTIPNTANTDRVVLIFGMGYDNAVEDVNPCLITEVNANNIRVKNVGSGSVVYTQAGSCTIDNGPGTTSLISRTKGRGIMVVDALNGEVIWRAGGSLTSSSSSGTSFPRSLNVPGMTCSIPSDVTPLDKNRDGLSAADRIPVVDRVYVGDTCGNVWRVDMVATEINDWSVTKIAAMSSPSSTDIAGQRKFLFPPDLVFSTDGVGNYTAVLIGSGDREHAFDTNVSNSFYMMKDRDASAGSPVAGAPNNTTVSITGVATASTAEPTTAGAAQSTSCTTCTGVFDATNTVGANDRGWKINLLSGEKVVSGAATVAGTTFFNTNQPDPVGSTSCNSNLGIAREYLVAFADGAATTDLNAVGGVTIADRSIVHKGGGYLPSPVPVVVEIDGTKYQAVISGTSVQTPPGLTLDKRARQYWYKEID